MNEMAIIDEDTCVENFVGPASYLETPGDREMVAGVFRHRHWCEECHGFWLHDGSDCLAEDAVVVGSPDWPCPEHR